MATAWKVAVTALLVSFCDNNHGGHVVDAWGGSSRSGNSTVTKKGLQLVGSCSQEDFQVKAVYLVCDSPGAYYRGSSTYRDSETCIYGDKARLQLEFKIKDSFTGASSIRLEVESGLYDQWKRVAILDDLCSYAGSNLQRVYSEYESMTSCPTPGLYQLDTYFTVPAFTVDSELHYTPDLRFRFYNAKGNVLGCATTGTLALSGHAREHAQQGLFALMGAFFALICLFSSLIYLNYGRERRMLAEKRELKMQQSMGAVAAPSPSSRPSQQDADHDQRYHYFNGNEDEQGLNGSSHTSNTSNAGSSLSSHPQRKHHPPL
ncbi:expressed unknown protein [Seminavis robusta]|uniref:Uncharacterized protein n=1 Tax=Seminavis robusta TaxID=568900 RepID=A0A9N8ESI6_9STRA|nr:expressed unknown protein [Seminavis robusta]|eukprot:Sro1819_g299670.1 n/a (318) ;mRNA; r:12215-13283